MTRSTADELLLLHHRLIEGDRTVPEEIASRVLEPLHVQLQQRFPTGDEHIVREGVIDAVLEYCARPERIEVATGRQLHSHLATRAWRNVANTLRGEKRRKLREGRAAVEAAAVEEESALGTLIRRETEAERDEQIRRLLDLLPDESDRDVLRLRLSGERRTEVFARVLGIEHLPVSEQRKVVKRVKDRIEKVLRRSKEVRG